MWPSYDQAQKYGGRSPHGERGLKLGDNVDCTVFYSRSPHGERGLKCIYQKNLQRYPLVALLMESVD